MDITKMEINFKSNLWIWDGPSPWYFVTVPKDLSEKIRSRFRHVHRGWGSIPVEVNIGGSIWRTSIFWEKKGTYLLPIKKEVRIKENLVANKKIEIGLKIEEII